MEHGRIDQHGVKAKGIQGPHSLDERPLGSGRLAINTHSRRWWLDDSQHYRARRRMALAGSPASFTSESGPATILQLCHTNYGELWRPWVMSARPRGLRFRFWKLLLTIGEVPPVEVHWNPVSR
jgi:hypothetical protein